MLSKRGHEAAKGKSVQDPAGAPIVEHSIFSPALCIVVGMTA